MGALTTDLRRRRAAYAAQLEGAVSRLVAVLSAIPEVERVTYAQARGGVLDHSTEGAVCGADAMASEVVDFVEQRLASGQWSGLARLGVGESSRGIRRRGGWRTCAMDLPRRFAGTVRSARRTCSRTTTQAALDLETGYGGRTEGRSVGQNLE